MAEICAFYKRQRDAFLESAARHLTGLAEWNVPEAGMFVWIKLLNITDSFELISTHAVKKKVLLVPGTAFMPNGGAALLPRPLSFCAIILSFSFSLCSPLVKKG